MFCFYVKGIVLVFWEIDENFDIDKHCLTAEKDQSIKNTRPTQYNIKLCKFRERVINKINQYQNKNKKDFL